MVRSQHPATMESKDLQEAQKELKETKKQLKQATQKIARLQKRLEKREKSIAFWHKQSDKYRGVIQSVALDPSTPDPVFPDFLNSSVQALSKNSQTMNWL